MFAKKYSQNSTQMHRIVLGSLKTTAENPIEIHKTGISFYAHLPIFSMCTFNVLLDVLFSRTSPIVLCFLNLFL
jgi:hypothetical protein